MSKVGGKGFRAGGVWGAGALTAGGAEVPGVLPRGKEGELQRIRERVYQIDFQNPTAWETANGKMLRKYLALACNRIQELERKLAAVMKGTV